MNIASVLTEDFKEWVKMGLLLWPKHSRSEISEEFKQILISNTEIAFVAKENGTPVGFVTVSIKKEHVPGATTYPVGYLEGLYIKKEYRNKGIARELVKTAEDWIKSKGCKEIGSDTWDWNKESIEFHKKLGFTVHSTLVHFIKKLS